MCLASLVGPLVGSRPLGGGKRGTLQSSSQLAARSEAASQCDAGEDARSFVALAH